MAKVAVPVTRLEYADEDAYTSDIVDMLMGLGVWQDDELTFTGRVVVPDAPEIREQVAAGLRALMPEEQAEHLLALLERNEWDLSLFVDCW